MTYADVLKLIEDTVTKYKGDLYFGTGTLNELNASDHRNYPLVWVNQALQQSVLTSPNNILIKTYSITIQFLQTISLTTKREQSDKIYNDLEQIAMGFIGKLVREFDTNGTDGISFSSLNQIYKQQDSIHIGWTLAMTIVSDYSIDHCCSLFED